MDSQRRVIVEPGTKLKPCPTQSATLEAAKELDAEKDAGSGQPCVSRSENLDLAVAMQDGLGGLHAYVAALYRSESDFACVEFLCDRIQAALEGGPGLEYFNLMQTARQAVNNLRNMLGAPEHTAFPLPPMFPCLNRSNGFSAR